MIQKKLQDKGKDNYETACSHFHLTISGSTRKGLIILLQKSISSLVNL